MTAARLPRTLSTALAAAAALVAAGPLSACGKEIGDSCLVSTDCGADINLICDQFSFDGYCTIPGCDYGTCPDGAVCIRFFSASFENLPCVPTTEDLPDATGTNDCGLDEVCTLSGQCVPESSESRFCMKTCDGDDDCRARYECRDEALMRAHGGEPVPAPGERLPTFDAFCAEAPLPP